MSSAFIQLPLKKTQHIDYVKPLSNYIKNTFSSEVLNENKDTLAELNQLRGNAVVRSLDKHEASLEVLQRYYDQLVTMEAKLPITEDQIRISFTWYDAFDKGSIFGSTKSSMSSGAYERFSVLFNIGSLLSQLASNQNHTTDDGLKTAAKYYQQAAGIFSYLKDNVYPVLQTLPTPDLAVSSLATLSAIMLAQAQDCFCMKATSDNMKDSIVAKLAMQAGDYYQEAVRAATHYEVKGMWDKEWIPILQCKQNYFFAMAEFHQSNVNVSAGAYGEQVGRLQKADKLINDAIKLGATFTPDQVKSKASDVSKKLTLAKKDNEFIYNEPVPKPDGLSAVGRATLAKPLPVTCPISTNFVDLFTKLVPMSVHQALASYDSAKANIINVEVGKLREATQYLNGVLASLNLPAAIEDLSGGKCPQSVLDKATELKEKGGLGKIDQLMQNLPDLLTRNREVLDETFRMLDEEEREDKQMRDHFTERWTRTPSAKLTGQLREEGGKYKNILDNATNADSVVKEKYNTHRRGLEILSMSEADIAASLPKGDTHISGSGADAVNELRQYMEEVKATKQERDDMEKELKGATVDMQSRFLKALAEEGYLDTERIVGTNLEDVFGGIKTQVGENLEKQNALIEKIQSSNDRFNASKEGSVNQRDQVLKDLAAAYDAFIELSANLEEGTKDPQESDMFQDVGVKVQFYNDLTEILLKFQSKCADLVFARKTEKDDLSKDLQQQAAKGTAAPTPNVPAYQGQQQGQQQQQQQQQQQRQQPPPRPTPPSRPPQPQQQHAPPQQQQQTPVPAPRPQPHGPHGSAPPPTNPNAPYPTQPNFMPQPGYYAPPGGMPAYNQGYYPPANPYGAPPQPYMPQNYPPAAGQYAPPYAQQPPMGYQGYNPYQQQQQQPPRR